MDKVGLFFGSFDPVHIGHVNAVRQVLETEILDEVWIIPSIQNPHKAHAPVSWEQRYDMCIEAFKPLYRAVVNNIEAWMARRNMSTKTYDVIAKLKEQWPENEYHFIVEYSELTYLNIWYKGEDIIKENNLIVTFRKATVRHPKTESNILKCEEQGHEVEEILDGDILEISSTLIRHMVYENKEIYPLVPEGVRDFIKKHNLYE